MTTTRVIELTHCPICGRPTPWWKTIGGFPIHHCADCQHSFLAQRLNADHVNLQYGDSYFCGGGDGYADYAASEQIVRNHVAQYTDLLANRAALKGQMIAVGAAAGFDLLPFREQGWQVAGIEPNRNMCRRAAEHFQLTMHATSLEDFVVQQPVDCAIAIQVMGHFVDIQQAAAKFAQLVRPGGWLLIETWNVASWTATCLGRFWHEYSPPSVVHWFSPRSLAKLLQPYGFRPLQQVRPRKRIRGEHAASLLSHKLGQLPGGRLWKRFPSIIPAAWVFPYPAEDLFYILFERS